MSPRTWAASIRAWTSIIRSASVRPLQDTAEAEAIGEQIIVVVLVGEVAHRDAPVPLPAGFSTDRRNRQWKLILAGSPICWANPGTCLRAPRQACGSSFTSWAT